METDLSFKTALAEPSAINRETVDQLKTFLDELFTRPLPNLATFSFEVSAIDPLAYLQAQWEDHKFQYHWEHPDHQFALSASGCTDSITAEGSNRFQNIQSDVQEVKESAKEFRATDHHYSGLTMVGGFSFFDACSAESWQSFEPAEFKIPKWSIIRAENATVATFALDPSGFDGRQHLYEYIAEQLQQIEQGNTAATKFTDTNYSAETNSKANFSVKNDNRKRWINSVQETKKSINNGDVEKVVLARKITVSHNSTASPAKLINRLRQRYSGCYNFLVHQPGGSTFLGSTPERLGSVHKQQLMTEAVAGSIGRGPSDADDIKLENALKNSPKNLQEHRFVVQDIKDQLTPIATSIDFNPEPKVKKLANVQHLYTPINARLQENINILDIIEHMHPTPAVGGYPRRKAIPYIQKMETFDRGWYAGPVGWLNSSGSGSFAVAIRSGLLTDYSTSFFAGCGIVTDSDPQEEWEETNLKFKPMLSALQYD